MKKFSLIFLSFVLFLTLALPAFAQDARKLSENPQSCLYIIDGDINKAVPTIACIVPLFANIIYWLMIFAGTVAVFFIIFGGIKLLTSSGAPDKVDGARKTITWSVVGLVVVLSSFMIVNILADITGVNCISRFGFTNCGGSGNLQPCSADHPTGYCRSAGDVCVRIDFGRYQCETPCNIARSTSGYCSNGTCQKSTTPYGVTYWTCKK